MNPHPRPDARPDAPRAAQRPARRFARTEDGAITLELLIVLPILAWSLVATVVFFDGFRTRNQTQVAAQIVADLLSRETSMFTQAGLEGMNEVFDFIADARVPTRLRISSVIWSSADQRNALQWSYGTRGLAPLPPETFEDFQNNDHARLVERFASTGGSGFMTGANQAPATWLVDRIPPVLPGEALIMVESFAIWSPFANVGVGQMRFAPVVVTRPRFSPFIHLEGAVPIFPEDDYEVAFAGYFPAAPDQLPPPAPQPEAPPPPIVAPVVVAHETFTSSASTTAWSRGTTGTIVGLGSFLGRFGGETQAAPVTRAITLPNGTARVRIEFDLLVFDSWDGLGPSFTNQIGDAIALQINGSTIAIDAFQPNSTLAMNAHARSNSVPLNGSTWSVSMTRVQTGTNLGGATWNDDRWRVVLIGDAPPLSFTLGFSASTDEAVDNESFGIADFRITAEPGTPQVPSFWPSAATQIGVHPQTRFPVHSGCPDPRIGAARLRVNVSDLAGTAPPAPPTAPSDAQGLRGLNGQTFAYTVTASTSGTIWGTDIYSDDSRIARAAIHAGLLTSGQTGVVLLTVLPGQASYAGTTRNGIQSQPWGSWVGSYSLALRPPALPSTSLSLTRQAAGGTQLSGCPGLSGTGHFHAAPTYVIDYNNEGLSGTGFRLRIETNDSNNGNTCNSALLVRAPNGQFFNSDDRSSTNRNARVDFGSNPASGLYHVWLGTSAATSCNTQLIVTRH